MLRISKPHRSRLIRLASTLSVGSSERQALLDVLAASTEDQEAALQGMLWLSGMRWHYIPQPEDAAGGPVDSSVLASRLKWGVGGVASVLRQLQGSGLVGSVKDNRGKSRWYLTEAGMRLARSLA